MRAFWTAQIGLAAFFLAACTSSVENRAAGAGESAFARAGQMNLPSVHPEEHPGLKNVYRLGDRIVSGSEPHGEAGFTQLAEMGVKTILSVDGKSPDQEAASAHGMRYVHVPIQYRGMTEDEFLRITKTFRELEGPFYVHCFHGKHRGPAAAAVGRIVLDSVSRERALAEMRQWCGTSEKYEGLYSAVASNPIPTSGETDRYAWSFPASQPLTGFRHSMTEVSRSYDFLKDLSRNGWEVDAEHPDIDPVNEADKLSELFVRTERLPDVKEQPSDFRLWVSDSVRETKRLQYELSRVRGGGHAGARESADRAFSSVTSLCTTCHASYRND